jgi:hypothetical protein
MFAGLNQVIATCLRPACDLLATCLRPACDLLATCLLATCLRPACLLPACYLCACAGPYAGDTQNNKQYEQAVRMKIFMTCACVTPNVFFKHQPRSCVFSRFNAVRVFITPCAYSLGTRVQGYSRTHYFRFGLGRVTSINNLRNNKYCLEYVVVLTRSFDVSTL